MSSVLIVEDQAPIARLLQTWAEAEGMAATVAASAEQGLLLAAERAPAVALCDIRLPGGRDGFWLVEQLRVLRPETAVVMTTGLNDFDTAVTGLRMGVTDYIVKPYTREQIKEGLKRALTEHELRRAALPAPDAPEAGELASRVKAALVAVLRAQEGPAVSHAQRVSDLSVRLATALGLSPADVSRVEHTALLCDVERLDIHTLGRKALHLGEASAIAVAVQERFNGSGFPLGLRGEAIPLGARIVGVADAFEELVMGAGPRFDPADAVVALCQGRADQFDPAVLEALRQVQQTFQSTAA
ncbi:MAG: hypothetical protein A3F70_01160 [Acidobacteria bacterium RIFCSPLOWO2_12_FULL_67_14]|nr:MAG: hypothetical protein A3H29_12295 [Acidobacteria bacterium RIFCSPLOWO2_02_FULL_67_21]OFW38409.1 MAG: hypothetical protein A3F70_01160 [Acidobacteria bacterium RIFCSPLOWO2_12_FULL_67_14]